MNTTNIGKHKPDLPVEFVAQTEIDPIILAKATYEEENRYCAQRKSIEVSGTRFESCTFKYACQK